MSSSTLQEIRVGACSAVLTAIGLGAYVIGAATGLTYPRFLGLRAAATFHWKSELTTSSVFRRTNSTWSRSRCIA